MSTTHSIVGAVIGMSMVAAGPDSVVWSKEIDSFPFLSVRARTWAVFEGARGLLAATAAPRSAMSPRGGHQLCGRPLQPDGHAGLDEHARLRAYCILSPRTS